MHSRSSAAAIARIRTGAGAGVGAAFGATLISTLREARSGSGVKGPCFAGRVSLAVEQDTAQAKPYSRQNANDDSRHLGWRQTTAGRVDHQHSLLTPIAEVVVSRAAVVVGARLEADEPIERIRRESIGCAVQFATVPDVVAVRVSAVVGEGGACCERLVQQSPKKGLRRG